MNFWLLYVRRPQLSSCNKELLKNVSIAAASTIPLVGGPLSVLLDKYLPDFVEDRRQQLWIDLSQMIERLEAEGEKPDIQSQNFLSVFVKCFRLATEEYEAEKIEAFRNIIVNSSLPNSSEFDETTLFMNWVREFTVDQIRVLKAIKYNDEIAYDSSSPDLYYILKSHFPDVPKDYLIMCAQELVGKNIVVYGKGHRVRELENKNNKTWFLSNMGERFVNYIESPIKCS